LSSPNSAARLGLDPAWRGHIRRQIAQRLERLYDEEERVRGLERFYRKAVQERLEQGPWITSNPTLTAGMVAPDRVFLIENHDEAYTVWRDLGVRNRILVHIDAHHNKYGQWPAADGSRPQITIANRIYPVVEEGALREGVWVVPDRTLNSRAGRWQQALDKMIPWGYDFPKRKFAWGK
jgi:hypothetical protein